MPSKIPEIPAGSPITDAFTIPVARDLNALMNGWPVGQRGIRTTGMAVQYPPPLQFEQLRIDGVNDPTNDANGDDGLYLAYRRLYDHTPDDEEWSNETESANGEESRVLVDCRLFGENLVLLAEDLITCWYHEQRGAWVPLNPPLERLVKADATIQINTSGTCSIWRWPYEDASPTALEDSTRNLTAHLRWMHGDVAANRVSAGKQALVRYFVDSGLYMIVQAECED